MSRSDSRQAPPGGYRPQAAPPQAAPAQSAHVQGEYDLSGWAQGLGGAPLPNPKPQQAAAPQGYPQQPAYGAQQTAPDGYGYGQPDQGNYWGAEQQPAAAPQFDPYVPQTSPSRRPVQPAPDAYGAPPYAQQPPAGYGNGYAHPEPALRGAQYDQWAAAPPPAPPASDPRGYDLASYMPPQGRTQQPQQPEYGHLTADLATHPQSGYSDWGHQAGGYQQPPQGYAPQPGYDAAGYAQQGYDQQGYADPNAQGYEDDGYEYEEPARGRKWMSVAAALVGAIVVGGGLTYAYQSLMGEGGGGPTPVVKSAEGPLKTKPTEPGGKQFANTDSKLLGRLGDGGSSAGSSSGSDNTGARKVQTLVVGRDGAIQAPAAAPSEPVSIPGVSVPVPGMTLVDVPVPGSPATPIAQKPQPIVVQPPSEPVQVASNEQRQAPVMPKSINTQDDAPPPAPVAEKPKPKPVTKTAAIPASTAPVTKPSGLGYVAVLASVPASGTSRITALQQFADLQQRYGGILQNKTPDVTEANLGEKGRYHRLVVGPPGSKDGANSVCSQLKTAGYSSCWVMAY
jgi:hypothetical protein